MSYSDHRPNYDTFILKNKDYQIVNSSPNHIFNPESHGITPYTCSDYCDAKPFDFVCSYRIRKNSLYLERLRIRSNDGHYPMINGRRATRKSNKYLLATLDQGRSYAFPEFKIGFTGKIWLGRIMAEDFNDGSLNGLSDETSYEQVLELELENGVVSVARDLSKKFGRLRAIIQHVSSLQQERLLTVAESNTLEKLLRSPMSEELDTWEAKLLAIERAIYKPSHFVSLLERRYLQKLKINKDDHSSLESNELLSSLLTMDDFASMRVPPRLRNPLKEYIRDGNNEKVVLAYFVQMLIASLTGVRIDDRLRASVIRIAKESSLDESVQKSIMGMIELGWYTKIERDFVWDGVL